MYRLLGDLIHEGVVMKIADDLYVGGDDIHTLLHNWERVLRLFKQANHRLSPSKTVVCPITTTVLGWIWSAGSLSVSPHKVNPLTQCELPVTVKALRGWCGAAKHIKACIPQYSALLADFEKATAGKESREKVSWTEELKSSFKHAQEALANPKTITIPRRDDHLIITNDGAVRNGGIGSILYILRNGRMLLGGYYSAKLKPHHERWLPCEVEALAISSATNHWSTLILQSFHQTQILSDSRPCILAYEKLCRGEYSMSARVSTFLSTLSQYRVKLQHIAGSANLPADYLSRSAMECSHKNCQICKFVAESENSVVMLVTVSDILSGKSRMPFTNSASWKQTQQDCPALRRVFAHLSQGTRPGKKATNIKDIKRYLKVATLGADGLLVVKSSMPFVATRSLIVVPRHVLAGFLTSLHLQLQHPVASQLQKIFDRHFYSLDSQKEIKTIVNGCAQCSALRSMPKEVPTFTSSQPPSSPGVAFACDIMCRARQKIIVYRDVFSSFTLARIIANEQKESIRNSILECTAELKAPNGVSIRVDGASAMQSLRNDPILQANGIVIEVGELKNINKNPIAEKAIGELEREIRKAQPEGGPISSHLLALTVAVLNRRIRNRGLSSKEIITQRDDLTGEQFVFEDNTLADQMYQNRLNNHIPSAASKAPRGKLPNKCRANPGDLVYLKSDGTKHQARDRYIVTRIDNDYVTIKKLCGSRFGSKEYKVKTYDIYCVPSVTHLHDYHPQDEHSADSSTEDSDYNGNNTPFPRLLPKTTSDSSDTDSDNDAQIVDIPKKLQPHVIEVSAQPDMAARNPVNEDMPDSDHDSAPDISDYEDIADSDLNTSTQDTISSRHDDFNMSPNNHATSRDTSMDGSDLFTIHNQCVHPLSQALDLASHSPNSPNVSISRRRRARPKWLQSGDWDTD